MPLVVHCWMLPTAHSRQTPSKDLPELRFHDPIDVAILVLDRKQESAERPGNSRRPTVDHEAFAAISMNSDRNCVIRIG
eukprot:13602211-Alexandrium_andersonii.AAC.1